MLNSSHVIPPAISTGKFSLHPAMLARRDFARIAGRWWWCAAIPVAGFMIMGAADWRWLVVALALIFIFLTTAAMFAWFASVSRKSIITEIYPHRVTLAPNGNLEVEYFPLPSPDDEAPATPTANGHPAETAHIPPAKNIKSHQISMINIEGNHIVITLHTQQGTDHYQHNTLLVPADAFASPAQAAAFFNAISASTSPRQAATATDAADLQIH